MTADIHADREPSSALAALGNLPQPLELGGIGAQAEEQHSPRDPTRPLKFTFVCYGIPFAAEVDVGDQPNLSLEGNLGALPYTAEAAAARVRILAVLAATRKLAAADFALGEDQTIRIRGARELDQPLDATSIVTGVARILLPTKPYLDLIQDYLPDDA